MVGSLDAALRRMLFLALLCACVVGLAAPANAKTKRVHRLHLRHHVDPVSAFPKGRRARPRARTSAFATTWGCTEATSDLAPLLSDAPQVKVIYAYTSDRSDQLASGNAYGNLFQRDADALRTKVATESASGAQKMIRFDVGGTGNACTADSANRLDIQTVQLSHPSSFYTNAFDSFYSIIAELEARLIPATPHQRVNYLVYADGVDPLDAGGVGDAPRDTTHGYTNVANHGRNGDGQLFGVVFGGAGPDFVGGAGDSERQAIALHELSHTLGAVQDNVPHASGAAHCFDGDDIMCYDDNGPYFTNGGSLTSTCAGGGLTSPLDCNKDDYFNASPAAGSFLTTNWNEYDSVFLCRLSECDTQLPAFSVSLAVDRSNGPLALVADAGGQPIEHFEWNTDGDSVFEAETGSTARFVPHFAAPGKYVVEVRAVKADGSFAYASTTVNTRPPSPSLTVSGNRVVNSPITLDGSGTSDPDGMIQHYRWDLDSNGTFESDTGLTPVATTSYPTAGFKGAGLQIDYGFGFAQTFATFEIAGPAAPGTQFGPTGIAAPTLSVLNVRLAKLLKSGLRLSIRCNALCTVQFSLSLDPKTAKRLHLRPKRGKPVVIGRLHGQFVAGTVRPVLKLSASAKTALRRARRLTATLSGSIKQQGVSPLTVKRAMHFRR